MNVCDYCGAVYNETCKACEEPHIVLYYNIYSEQVKTLFADSRVEAEERLRVNHIFRRWSASIVPRALWVEAIENLLDWRP